MFFYAIAYSFVTDFILKLEGTSALLTYFLGLWVLYFCGFLSFLSLLLNKSWSKKIISFFLLAFYFLIWGIAMGHRD